MYNRLIIKNYDIFIAIRAHLNLKVNFFYHLLVRVSAWSDGAMVLGKLPIPGRPTIRMIVGQGPIAVGAGGGCLDIFTLLSFLFSFSLSGRWPDIN